MPAEVVLCLLLAVTLAQADSILFLTTIFATSHTRALSHLARELTDRGHDVTFVTWRASHLLNVTNIDVLDIAVNNSDGRYPYLTKEPLASFVLPNRHLWEKGLRLDVLRFDAFQVLDGQCSRLLGDTQLFFRLLHKNFSVAVVDLLYNECSLALAHRLGVPVIGYWWSSFTSGECDYTTAPLPAASTPRLLSGLSGPLSFLERMYNSLLAFLNMILMNYQFYCTNYWIQHFIPGTPHPRDLLANLSGALINSDYVIADARLLPPSFINVGGLQITGRGHLPQDLENFMVGAGEPGVVLFSLGFTFEEDGIPASQVQIFLEAFRRLSQRVVMKYPAHLDGVPPNVKLMKFVPQEQILAHRQTKVFFTHCGMHGTLEAIYYAVPMVGMPVFLDQGDNMVQIEKRGIGVGVSKKSSVEDIVEAIHEVLNNQVYRENIQRLSTVFRSAPVRPVTRGAHLVELVVQTKGAPHLKLSSRHLSLFQNWLLDVFLVLILLVVVTYRTTKWACQAVWSKFRQSSAHLKIH